MAWLNGKAIYSIASIRAQERRKRKKDRKQRQAEFAKQVQSAIAEGVKVQVLPYVEPARFERPRKRDRIKELEQQVADLKASRRLPPPRYEPGMKGDFYLTREWRSLRWDVLQAHGFKCNACGRTQDDGIVIHVDHIKPRSKFPALELVFSNLQVLCDDCNIGKSNK